MSAARIAASFRLSVTVLLPAGGGGLTQLSRGWLRLPSEKRQGRERASLRRRLVDADQCTDKFGAKTRGTENARGHRWAARGNRRERFPKCAPGGDARVVAYVRPRERRHRRLEERANKTGDGCGSVRLCRGKSQSPGGVVTRTEFGRVKIGSLSSGSGRGGGSPRPERFISEDAERAAGREMALDVKRVLDGGVNRQESLG